MSGFLYAWAQTAVVLVAVAGLALVLGWLLGRRRVPTSTPSLPAAPTLEAPQPSDDVSPAPDAGAAHQLELDAHQVELGRLEAAAVAAWERTVPELEGTIEELRTRNADLVLEITRLQDALDAELKRYHKP